ncbi:5-oxoprolinase subunit PxpB [Halomonas sp. Bachu 37]|uniref:5-oxoprolinase subunit PxpB n=1 Tax=Halomonas kashgarensis TaxID=3084920 RepID=UPI00321702A1
MSHLPRIESAGLDGWLVRLFDEIEETNVAWLSALAKRCEAAFGKALVDLIPSYTTLLVIFDPFTLAPGQAREVLASLLATLEPGTSLGSGKIKEVPVCYDVRFAADLPRVAERAGMELQAVIDCHSDKLYRVFALGFAPGFAFMGSVDSRIETPRLETPRQRIPAGSVALAGRQTAAYPLVSPGGWNILGRTPATLFDRHRQGFSLLQVGDRVRFIPLSFGEYKKLGGDIRPMESSTTITGEKGKAK